MNDRSHFDSLSQAVPFSRRGFSAAAAGKAKDVEFFIYQDAPHAFNADYRPSYRKEAAEDGWRRMLAFFKRHGVA